MNSQHDSATPTGGGFTELIAWQKAYRLTLNVYKATAAYPGDERFGLTSQSRRAAASIACNIAEGWGRGSTRDYRHFAQIARDSTNELQTLVWLGRDLGFLDSAQQLTADIDEVQRLLTGLIRSLIDKQR